MFMGLGAPAADMAMAMEAGVAPKFWLKGWGGAKGWPWACCIMLGVPDWLGMPGDMVAAMFCGG